MATRFALKWILLEKFGSQVLASRKLGIRESRLSYLVRGHADPSDGEIKVFERILGRNVVARLFNRRLKLSDMISFTHDVPQ